MLETRRGQQGHYAQAVNTATRTSPNIQLKRNSTLGSLTDQTNVVSPAVHVAVGGYDVNRFIAHDNSEMTHIACRKLILLPVVRMLMAIVDQYTRVVITAVLIVVATSFI